MYKLPLQTCEVFKNLAGLCAEHLRIYFPM